MMERFAKSMFGWQVEPPAVVIAEPPSPRPIHPEARLLQLLGASFEELESDAEMRAAGGLAPGAIEENRDASGAVAILRRKRYASMLQAGVDAQITAMADPAAQAEARRLQPLAARHEFRRALRALDGAE
jgi:hypothetical protein